MYFYHNHLQYSFRCKLTISKIVKYFQIQFKWHTSAKTHQNRYKHFKSNVSKNTFFVIFYQKLSSRSWCAHRVYFCTVSYTYEDHFKLFTTYYFLGKLMYVYTYNCCYNCCTCLCILQRLIIVVVIAPYLKFGRALNFIVVFFCAIKFWNIIFGIRFWVIW